MPLLLISLGLPFPQGGAAPWRVNIHLWLAARPQVKCKTRPPHPPAAFLIKQQIKPPKCLLNICSPVRCALRGMLSAARRRGPNTPGWQKAGLKASNSLCPTRVLSLVGWAHGRDLQFYHLHDSAEGPLHHTGRRSRGCLHTWGAHWPSKESKCAHPVGAPSRSGGIHRQSEDRGQGGSSLGPGVGWGGDDCLPQRAAQTAFSEISGSSYGHDMAMKLLRPGPSQVLWTQLLTAVRGRLARLSCAEGTEGPRNI